jgi:rhodanese-related sulfurtransferase
MIKNITPEDLSQKIGENQQFVLLDVRTPGEFSRGKIKASINLPLDNVENRVRSVVPDLNSTVYVYCLSGSRSEVAAEIMDRLGYKNVYNLTQGMLAWRVKGFPVEI